MNNDRKNYQKNNRKNYKSRTSETIINDHRPFDEQDFKSVSGLGRYDGVANQSVRDLRTIKRDELLQQAQELSMISLNNIYGIITN